MKDNKTNEKTYVVYCHTTPDGMQYIGTTCNVKQRWFPSTYKNSTLFYDAIERFGWKNIKHEVLFSGLTSDEALKLEDQLIVKARENGTCLNMQRSGHYQQSDAFIEDEKARKKAWVENNPEKHRASNKVFRDTHPDYMREYMREWRKRKKGNGGKK